MKDKEKIELLPCPKCNKAWLYVSDGDYYSDYESKGYRVNCTCGYAWKAISWQKTRQEAIQEWNRTVNKMNKEKQIEEIETIIKSNLAEGSFANAFARKVAIQIVEHYQPKLPENSVVLSKEEYESLKLRADDKCKYDCWLIDMPDFEREKDIKTQASKEMAEKILKEASKCSDNFYIKVKEILSDLDLIKE